MIPTSPPAGQGIERYVRPREWGLMAGLLAVVLLAVIIYYRQNHADALGGPISVEKTFWLGYTLAAWFVFPAYLATDPHLSKALRRIFAVHLGSMVARGAVELVMLYGTVSWNPIYGIGHDLFHTALLLALVLFYRAPLLTLTRPRNRVALFMVGVLVLGMIVEAVFAAVFLILTTGEAGTLYFAADNERFAVINRVTLVVVVLAYGHLLWTLYRLLNWV